MVAVTHKEWFIWCNLLNVGHSGVALLKLCIACSFCPCVQVDELAHAFLLGVAWRLTGM